MIDVLSWLVVRGSPAFPRHCLSAAHAVELSLSLVSDLDLVQHLSKEIATKLSTFLTVTQWQIIQRQCSRPLWILEYR